MEVMDLFEQAKLKGQKLNLSTLLTKPEFKQQYLTPIRKLDENDQCALLRKVIAKECSLGDLKKEAARLKQTTALKNAFVRLTNSESWSTAQEAFPLFATEKQLVRFIGIDLNKEVP